MDSNGEIVIKKGETCIQVSLRRGNKGGILLRIKAHPALEDLIRGWGNGSQVDARTMGLGWKSPKTIMVHHLADGLAGVKGSDTPYRLDRVGHPLETPNDKSINLSFLRIVGVSEGEGASFAIPGIYELDDMRDLASRIKGATRKFYVDYMLPVDLTITMSTQEVKL